MELTDAKLYKLNLHEESNELKARFENVSYNFIVGLTSGSLDNIHYTVISKLSTDIRDVGYIVNGFSNSELKRLDMCNPILGIFQELSLKELSFRWKELVNLYMNTIKRYTCIKYNESRQIVYHFNDIDFLTGFANAIDIILQQEYVEKIILFDNYQLCNVKFGRSIPHEIIVKELIEVLDIIPDLINIIVEYCESKLPINIYNIQLVKQEEYPMDKYSKCVDII